MFDAATTYNADTVVRITADCPLIDPETIDTIVSELHDSGTDYASNTIERTFPRGLDVEAFTYDSFERAVSQATTQAEREHVTQYYHNHPEKFDLHCVRSESVFNDRQYIDRTDLRLTLDEAADYRLLDRVYDEIEYADTVPTRAAIDLIDRESLAELNASVEQKSI
jgi:spore coat polysaccharide biosynthesis protein SpsF